MKGLSILFVVALMICCYSLWVSRDNYKNKYIELQNKNSKLDNTVKVDAKAVESMKATIESQKKEIARIGSEIAQKENRIKELAVSLVNIQTKYNRLNARKIKSKRRKKQEIAKKMAFDASKAAKERANRILIQKRKDKENLLKKINAIRSKIKKEQKNLKYAEGSVSRERHMKETKKYKKKIRRLIKQEKRYWLEIKKLKLE